MPVEDGTWTETIYEATLRGVSVVSESAPPGPWVVRNPQASVHVLADGRVFRVQPEEPDPYDPFTVLRRGDSGPFLLTATMFGGRPRVSRALPIEGTDVVLADGRMPLDEVTRLVGRAP